MAARKDVQHLFGSARADGFAVATPAVCATFEGDGAVFLGDGDALHARRVKEAVGVVEAVIKGGEGGEQAAPEDEDEGEKAVFHAVRTVWRARAAALRGA